ncbi:hypothetical protein SAMN02745911_1226 [Aureimonas altamirensis DSM 21988]|uniref:DUF4376 domain-containing protein n=2 Tax=Aureimonas altamirensis TaxID=370622 RepID=A0A0N7KX68_9HYPH|nr:hypothetical protein [Aureimonas altamirensis]BAT26081.1 hypothetical protein [Aureimonas altamirensis]SHI80581.1 hypothetical protein SAMN02745911_1226 [Aureimonas altamirensis DSM 21988]
MLEMPTFNPFDWYWLADDGRLFSSAVQAEVAADDAAYTEWSESNRATAWPRDEEGNQTDAALQEVLATYGLAVGMDRRKAALSQAIDDRAEAERLRWITPGAGQAMTYARKVEEAKAVQSATSPKAADYPMLAASIGLDGKTIKEVADTILEMDAAWATVGAAIEKRRLQLKHDVGNAADAPGLDSVDLNSGWPERP